jgi:hypothetical protein
MVIESHPLMEDGSPFPTTFWLTCPMLIKRASRLEAAGVMAEMTRTLQADTALRDRLADAVDRYRARRDSHLVIRESGGPPGGGPDRVKCLHSHLAHELADPPNPIGATTLAATQWPNCVDPCVVVET